MWRIEADVAFGQNYGVRRLYRVRENPMENVRDLEFQERYRFPKDVVAALVDRLEPALERYTHRQVKNS